MNKPDFELLDPLSSRNRSIVIPRNFSCPQCDKSFRDNFNLNIHLKVHKKAMEGKTELIKCNYCNKMLRSLAAYRSHTKTHGVTGTSDVMRLAEEQLTEEADSPSSDAEDPPHNSDYLRSSELALESYREREGLTLSGFPEVRCYICEITMGSVSFFAHMQWHAAAIAEKCHDTREKLNNYVRTLESADEVLRDTKWTVQVEQGEKEVRTAENKKPEV